MTKPLTSILLATNLQDYNKVAFDVAASLATHYQAKLILLHVLENVPVNAESYLTGLFGKEQRKEIHKAYAQNVHQSLTGKNISSTIIRDALDKYRGQAGKEAEKYKVLSREVIVSEGEVDECILQTAKDKNCGMIVMAAHEGLFSKSSISSIIKNVLRQSTVPVLTVPHVFEKTD